MYEKKPFETPEVETFHRDELLVESAFTAELPSVAVSDRRLKTGIRPVSARRTLANLLRR